MTYLDKHWKIFLKSFELDKLAFKLLATDIVFILTLVISYAILYMFWLKNLLSVSSIFNITSGDTLALSKIDITGLWHLFIIKIILILFVGVILYIVLISVYSALSHTFMNRKNFTLKLLLNFIGIYTILTVLWILLSIIIFNLSNNIVEIAWAIIIFTLLYLYALLIFYLVTNDGKFTKILHHGLKCMIQLHHTLIPILLGFVLMLLTSIIIGLLLGKFLVLSGVIALLIFLYLLTWFRKYLYHVIHEV